MNGITIQRYMASALAGAPTDNRTALGLGTAAVAAASDFLTPSGNGSSLTGLTSSQVGLGNVNNTAISLGAASTTTVGLITVNTQSITIGATTKAVLTT